LSEFDLPVQQGLDRLAQGANERAADWPDILQRSQLARRRSVLVATCCLVLAGAALASAAVFGPRLVPIIVGQPVDRDELTPAERAGLSRISGGRDVPLTTTERQPHEYLPGIEAVTISKRLLAARGGHDFWVETLRARYQRHAVLVHCWRFGHGSGGCEDPAALAGPRARELRRFPSPELPILDFSGIQASTANTTPRYFALEGIASDAVKTVAIELQNGELVAVTPVIDNVYLRTMGLPKTTGEAIVAIDSAGRRIYDACVAPECFAKQGQDEATH
jgi:hypothetical protein